jgi:diguanylate cyclase (GGDEF)-like protein/PAS domain S-box-containing protein
MKSHHADKRSPNFLRGIAEALRPNAPEKSSPTLHEGEPVGFLLMDEEGNISDADANICRMLDYRSDELIGQKLSDIIAEYSSQFIESSLNKTIPPVAHSRLKLRRNDGLNVSAAMTSVKMPDGKVLKLFNDATPHGEKQAESTRLAAIVESSDDAIIGKDLNSIITSWNAGAEKIFGYKAEEMLGTSITRLIPVSRKNEEEQIQKKIGLGEKLDHFETVRLTKDQRLIDVSVTISPLKDATGKIIGASKIARDITLLKARERELARIPQLYAALAQVNQMIAKTSKRDLIFKETCHFLIKYGGLQMAWIGWFDPAMQQLVPVAIHGDESDSLRPVSVYTDDSPEGRNPSGIAFRSAQPYVSNNMQDDPVALTGIAEIKLSGFRSCASFPIWENGNVGGTLNVYASEQDFFHEEEVLLLKEVASDLTVAIENIVLQDAHRHSEMVALSEKSFSDSLIENMPGVVVLFNTQLQLLRWNKNLMTVTGYTNSELERMHPHDFFPPEEKRLIEQKLGEAFETGEAETESNLLTKDGRKLPYLLIGRRIESKGNPCLLGIGVDISNRKLFEQQLTERDAILKEMSAMAHIGGWEFDPKSGDGIWTEEVAHIHEVDPAFATSASYGLSFFHGEHRERLEVAVREARESGTPYDLELQMVTASGNPKWVRSISHPVIEKGKVVRIRGAIQDITELKLAESKIMRLNRVYAVLSQINSLIVRVQDRDELFNEACQIATKAGGFRMAMIAIVDPNNGSINPVASQGWDDELLADIVEILSTRERASVTLFAKAIREKEAVVLNDSTNNAAVIFSNKYAEAGVNSMVVLPLIVTGEATGVLALYATEAGFFHEEEMQLLTELTHDIAFAVDHINKQEKLNYLAYYDELTGLANRALFIERVGQFIRNRDAGKRLALFLIDLERFKSVNDSLGNSAGDSLLIQFATWLTNHVKDPGLLARVGSDHFAVVMPQFREDGNLAKLVENALEVLQDRLFVVNNTELRVSAKFGIAIFPDDGNDADSLFRNAEAALKMAKRRGERYLFHTRQMTESVAMKLSLENQLRKAIDNEEFVLHYQPKVNLVTGKVTATEALIRWNDPRTGLVPPVQFIPLLEETGLIHEVGRWALRKAISDNLQWRKAGLPVMRIAVNVSSLQLRSPKFVGEIEKIAVDRQTAEGLQLEITESMIMEDIARCIDLFQLIRDMGITIAIDDFGTGFSSLNYLVQLPLDTLKVDRSFVVKMTEGPKDLAMVSTIINLAHSLNLNVVGEGVETEEQSRLLRLLGCDELQGFLFSKPIPAKDFEARFLN